MLFHGRNSVFLFFFLIAIIGFGILCFFIAQSSMADPLVNEEILRGNWIPLVSIALTSITTFLTIHLALTIRRVSRENLLKPGEFLLLALKQRFYLPVFYVGLIIAATAGWLGIGMYMGFLAHLPILTFNFSITALRYITIGQAVIMVCYSILELLFP